MKIPGRLPVLVLLGLCDAALLLHAETPAVPDWAQPGSASHRQVPPPPDFHRATRNYEKPIGMFDGQSDVGGALVPGDASYDATTKRYTIESAGYNIWYNRDEFRYLWKKMSGDVSLAAAITYPKPEGYGDRKAVLIIRQDLDDDSKEVMVALHGAGLIHLAGRPDKNTNIREAARIEAGKPASGRPVLAKRIGIEKHGDAFSLYVSMNGEPMHRIGPPMRILFEEPFYVGLAFCSHLPATSDTALLSEVTLENSAGKVR